MLDESQYISPDLSFETPGDEKPLAVSAVKSQRK
jgi:hypothetical protein